jgi:predicted metal-dependent phosphoesterase TrpH
MPGGTEYGVLKVELHAHTSIDSLDAITHSTRELIDHAASLRFDALAVTPHDRYFDPAGDLEYARARGLVLLAGIERTIGGVHVLLVNFPAACAQVRTFDDIAALKHDHPNGLVVAPHALFPNRSALGASALERQAALFDAVEINALYTRHFNFNLRAAEWARRHGKPLVGNGDIHLLRQLGTTYSLVDAPAEPDAICAAIKAGRVEVRMRPLSLARAISHFAGMATVGLIGRTQRLFGSRGC